MTRLAAGPGAYDFSADGALCRAASPARAWVLEGAVLRGMGADGAAVDLRMGGAEAAAGVVLTGEAPGVSVRCRVDADGALTVWRLELANRGRTPISDATLPLLRIRTLPPTGAARSPTRRAG